MLYGQKEIPFELTEGNIRIIISKENGVYSYFRDCCGIESQKLLQMELSDLIIAPVEPLNLPQAVASYLMIEFGREIILEPNIKQIVYLTFPLEIGVFAGKRDKYELLDIFSQTRLKYTLYGEPRNGFICKWWRSMIHLEEPKPDSLMEGIIKLFIHNASREWVTVNKALFTGVGMKIYYNNECVSMKAQMKVLEEESAEIEFQNSPLHRDMQKSPEIFTQKRLSVTSKKAVMLEGI